MTTPPRPNMTPVDRRTLQVFLASPDGDRLMKSVAAARADADDIELQYGQTARDAVRQLQERRGDNFWRDSLGAPLPNLSDTEAANAIPPDWTGSRSFRPVYMARRVSYWPVIVAVFIGLVSCSAALTWAVLSAIEKAHP